MGESIHYFTSSTTVDGTTRRATQTNWCSLNRACSMISQPGVQLVQPLTIQRRGWQVWWWVGNRVARFSLRSFRFLSIAKERVRSVYRPLNRCVCLVQCPCHPAARHSLRHRTLECRSILYTSRYQQAHAVETFITVWTSMERPARTLCVPDTLFSHVKHKRIIGASLEEGVIAALCNMRSIGRTVSVVPICHLG
jgi:hypothetical protein